MARHQARREDLDAQNGGFHMVDGERGQPGRRSLPEQGLRWKAIGDEDDAGLDQFFLALGTTVGCTGAN